MTAAAGASLGGTQFLTRARWSQTLDLAGKWLDHRALAPVRPADLQQVEASRAVYVPLRQILQPKPGTVVAYVGSVARQNHRAVWQRIVGEHQVAHLERLLGWDWVAVLPLRDDTPSTVVRILEAAVADSLGRPEACKRLPRLPTNWQVIRDTAMPVAC